MNEPALIENVTVRLLSELLQSMGYRTNESEQGGMVQLLSASQGIGFAIRFGNPATEQGHFIDFTLSCLLRVNGQLPEGLVSGWNQARRFSRLSEQGGFLVLEMDVIVAGGVSQRYLRANIELWDRLLQEYLLYLRTFATAQSAPSASDVGPFEPVTDAGEVPQAGQQPAAEREAGTDADLQSDSAAPSPEGEAPEAAERGASAEKSDTDAVVVSLTGKGKNHAG